MDWARDVGWKLVSPGSAFLLFTLGHSVLKNNVDMEVSAYPIDGATRVQFLARGERSFYPGWNEDLGQATEAFARGVLHDLALRGATVDPSRLAKAGQDRKQLKALERLRRRTAPVLLALVIPVPVLVGLLSHNVLLAVAAFGWLGGAILAQMVGRLRAAGMRARVQIVLVLVPTLFFALVLSIVGAFTSG
jgi:hypothetical protein